MRFIILTILSLCFVLKLNAYGKKVEPNYVAKERKGAYTSSPSEKSPNGYKSISKEVLDGNILDYKSNSYDGVGARTTRHLRLKDVVPLLSTERNSLDALTKLKATFPDLYEDYLLIYKSRSLQKASFQKPRVVLFSGDARLAIAFADPTLNFGNDNIELMEFDPVNFRFNFQEISYNTNKTTASTLNPQKCITCHQSNTRKNIDMRPNWEPYNVWPGVYASTAFKHILNGSQPRYTIDLKRDHANENSEYIKFMNSSQGHYKLLSPFQKLSNGKYVSASSAYGKVKTNLPFRLTLALSN